ncbi:hypothetical protein IAQ61_012071 [Plenodomus lingam]|uniref:uncharacterized protein n=1 Tax=Leptosphaeria maculans TaxID=5022 RepID=UPI003330583A|nr:hypothetical protein IAQ61_012071 [Plenodomus lingam]
MNTISNPIEGYGPATYYQPADPLSLLLIAFFFLLLGALTAAGSALVFSLLLRLPYPVTTHHLIAALADKRHPIHRHLNAQLQKGIGAAVGMVVGSLEDRVGQVIETHLLHEAVVQALEKELEALRRDISGRQQHEAGPHSKLRKSLSGLQAPRVEGSSSPRNDDDDLLAPKTPTPSSSPPSSLSYSPLSSRDPSPLPPSPHRHDSDSDSIHGSDPGQPAQTQIEPPVMDEEFDDELAALAGYESDGAGSASELDSDVDAEGETDDEYVPPPVESASASAPIVALPGLGNLAKRQIKPLASLKTKGTRR